jgi:hypothetical protein
MNGRPGCFAPRRVCGDTYICPIGITKFWYPDSGCGITPAPMSMVIRLSSKGPLARRISHALVHGSASITSRQVVEYIRAFKSLYPDSDIELAHPMIMARGYGDAPGVDYIQLVDADVFEDGEIELADWWGPYALWENDRPQSRAMA